MSDPFVYLPTRCLVKILTMIIVWTIQGVANREGAGFQRFEGSRRIVAGVQLMKMSVRGASRGEARAATEGGDELEDRLPEGPLHCPLARGHQGRPQQAQARQGHGKDTRCYLRHIVLEALHELGIRPKASLHNVKQPPLPQS